MLARVWRDHSKPSLALHPQSISDVTAALGSKIPEEVLAILVAEGRTAVALPALTEELTTYFEATHGKRGWRAELEFDHILFSRLPSDDSEPLYASFRRVAPLTLALWDVRRPQRGGVPTTVADYLRLTWSGLEAISDEEVAAFAPVVEAPPAAPPRRVNHPTFGVGTVLDERDQKLRIDFGPHGVKVLAARFVKDT